MSTPIETIVQSSEAEKQAVIRHSVRQQLGMLVAQAAQRPAAIQRLKDQLAQPAVVAAFGTEHAAVVAVVDSLV
jgi:hypothetical protein